jgi:branched-chain amino acid transport system substrate-binding protein
MHRSIARRHVAGAGAAWLLAGHAAAAAEPGETLTIAQIVELTGPAAAFGDAWRNGVELAVQERNAGGGLLGKLVQVVTFDAQSTAFGGRVAMQRALDLEPLAVLGPALSEASRGALAVLRARDTPLILGGNAADLTGAAHPATVRPLPSAAAMMARLCAWLHDEEKPARVAVLWSGHEPFRALRDALLPEARGYGIDLAAEWIAESGEPAADLSRLLKAAPDLLLVLVGPDLAGRVILEARRQAPQVRLIGDATLLAPQTLQVAGLAAEGVLAHVVLPPEPEAGPLAAFAARYEAANKQPPEELALAGYLAVGMVKAALDKAGSADAHTLAEALRGLSTTVATQPMLLADCTWNAAGTPDRPSWIIERHGGKFRSVATLRDAA